eukprot:CAMPEP_0194267398 /NCGR_PEP_ID=MMETSP0169-20130528/1911_1 /TAXON_ID=218684 /ORGANISM="Corethron pennatum, Strain L29A3" /LENGTH=799 /DNA_ID=CAMNT_0039008223 /DNA_START=156 /DNA_END=2552 /DNA_ORIENTATION=-
MVPILRVLSFSIVPLRYICGQGTTSLQVNELETLPKTSHVGKKNQKNAKNKKIDSFLKNIRGKKKKNKKYTFAPLSYPTSAPLLPITFGPAVTLSSAPSFKISSDDSDGSDDGTQFASDDGTQFASDDGTQFASDDGSPECNPDEDPLENYTGECTGICKPNMAEFSEIVTTFATSTFLKWFSMFPFIQDYGEEAFSTSIASKWNSYEEVPSSTGSYLLCNTDSELTGYQRSLFISSSCNLENIAESPVHNSVERTCFKAMLDFSSAHYCCTRPNMWVVPFTQWMKISENTILNALGPISDVIKFAANWFTDSASIGDRFSITFCDPDYEMRDFTNHLEEEWNNIKQCSDLPSFRKFVEFDAENSFQFNNIGSIFDKCLSWKWWTIIPCIINSVSCIVDFVTSISSSEVVCELEYNPPIEFFDPDDIEILQDTAPLRNHLDDAAFLHEKNIMGQGQVAQLSDSGVQVDSCYFYDQDGTVNRDKSEIFDKSKRKIIQYYTSPKNDGDSLGHGTHVAGVIAGQMCPYQNSRCESSDTNGVAPRAKLAVYDIFRARVFFDPRTKRSIENMLNMGRDSGAFIHSASWVKSGKNNNYKEFDKTIDEYLWKNRDHLAIFAAGNKGYKEGAESVKHVGKNLISVCNAHTKEYVYFSSSRGPTQGGQIKPDICAPGTLISSASLGDCSEEIMSGTSQAAPALTGIALLIRQYFIEGWYPSGIKNKKDGFKPSGYLVKAVMMNSGKKLSGVYKNRDGIGSTGSSQEYDTIQGFGLVSLTDGIFISGRSAMKRMKVFDEQVLTGNEKVW